MSQKSHIQVGDLVRTKKQHYYTKHDVELLPYNFDSIGLVLKVEKSSHRALDGSKLPNTLYEYYITVKWCGAPSTMWGDEYMHLEYELEIISRGEH